LAFVRMKPKDQVETLLGLIKLPEDPRILDQQRAAAFSERTAVNRDVKQLEGQLAGMPVIQGDVPNAEVSVRDLVTERDRLQAIRDDNETFRRDAAELAKARDAAQLDVARLEQELAAARVALEAATKSAREAELLATQK